MRPLGGKFTSTIRLHRGCSRSEACHLCQQCRNYDKFSAKCHECYPRRNGQPAHCLCAERGMDRKAQSISQYLDRAVFDVNGVDNGAVESHHDPAPEVFKRLNDEREARGMSKIDF